jgi:hypothetical protein
MSDDFETKKRELLNPLFVEAGAALMECQGFEYGIALLLYHFSRLGVVEIDPRQTTAIMENEEKKTAGQLITILKKHCEVSDSMKGNLTAALRARNKLIHRVLIDNAEKIPKPETRKELIKEIRELRSTVRKADQSIRTIVDSLGKAIDGFDPQEFENEIKNIFS